MPVKVRRIDLSPDEWIAGTLGLTLEEEGLYIKICVLIWSTGGRISEEHLKRCTASHGNKVNAILERLEVAGKITRNGSEIGQKRAEKELENAQKRVGNARENPRKWSRKPRENESEMSDHNGLSKPSGYSPATRVATRAEPSTSKEEGLAPKGPNPVFLTARESSPPLPSQGDGDADSRPPTTTDPAGGITVFDDPELKAYGDAAFDRCLEVLRGNKYPKLVE